MKNGARELPDELKREFEEAFADMERANRRFQALLKRVLAHAPKSDLDGTSETVGGERGACEDEVY